MMSKGSEMLILHPQESRALRDGNAPISRSVVKWCINGGNQLDSPNMGNGNI
jgi:hypothetical protein